MAADHDTVGYLSLHLHPVIVAATPWWRQAILARLEEVSRTSLNRGTAQGEVGRVGGREQTHHLPGLLQRTQPQHPPMEHAGPVHQHGVGQSVLAQQAR